MTQNIDECVHLDDYARECPFYGASNETGDFCYCDQYDDPVPCGCKYCYCMDDTIAGETCDNCTRGIHQG